jgi:hypothetical protein
MLRVPDGDCPQAFAAEAVGELADGTPVLLQVRFTLTELSPEDPRVPGDGFVHGGSCDCLLSANLQLAQALSARVLEEM